MTSTEKHPAWVDRLYPYKDREAVYPYIQPGHHLTDEEHNLNIAAHKGRLQFHDEILTGGRESTYLQYPQVAIGNWWDRCCLEVPRFMNSLGRRLPDNLTKCSEYREEISEYAKFFPDYPPEDIRPAPFNSCSKCVPPEVLMEHRCPDSPTSYWMTIYARDYRVPKPAIPPQMFGWADKKRRKWIEQHLDEKAIYCTDYQKNYDHTKYEKLITLARKASLCRYIKYEEERDQQRRMEHLKAIDSQEKERDRFKEMTSPVKTSPIKADG